MNNIKKFATESDYSSAILFKPSVSWVINGDTVHFDKGYSESSMEPLLNGYDVAVQYNVTDSENEQKLFANDYYGGFGVVAMEVDGVQVTPSSTYRFSSNGRHTVRYMISGNTIGEMAFSNDKIIDIAKIKIGKKITKFGGGLILYNNPYYSPRQIIIESETPPSIHEGTTITGIGDGASIFVPSSAIDAFKSEWSNYSSVIYPIV